MSARLLCILALLVLSACYQPLYGGKGFGGGTAAQESRLNQIGIAGIPGTHGQRLRNALIDRFYINGRPVKPDYELTIRFTLVETLLGIQKDATASRARLDLSAEYDLIDARTRKLLYTGFSRSNVGYGILDQQYGTMASKENAIDRGIRELADLIATRMLLAVSGNVPPPAAPAPAAGTTSSVTTAPNTASDRLFEARE